MNLFILRHAPAAERDSSGRDKDSDRPLTEKGREVLSSTAKGMLALDLSFDRVLTSPFARARQTAEIIAKELHAKQHPTPTEHLSPNGSPKALIEQINRLQPRVQNMLLVGHEPYLSQLIALLVAGNTNASFELKKGGLAKLETEDLRFGRCTKLSWLLTPQQMAQMG